MAKKDKNAALNKLMAETSASTPPEPTDEVYGKNENAMLNAARSIAEREILSGKYETTSGPAEALDDINDYLKVYPGQAGYSSKAESVADVYKANNRAGPKSFEKKTKVKEFRNGGSVNISNFKGNF
tara:strand:- start:25 stop:405 length:381 start_codon:yes stop_codon:yes gene_type:complete